MVAHFTMRTHVVNQEFRFAEGIWLNRNSHLIRFFFGRYHFSHPTLATCSDQPFDIKTRDEDPEFFSTDPDPAQLEKYYGYGFELVSKKKIYIFIF